MTAQILTFTPRETIYAPPRHDAVSRLQDAIAGTQRDIEQDLFWIAQYRRGMVAEGERPAFIEFAKKAFETHLRAYLYGLRHLHELEAGL